MTIAMTVNTGLVILICNPQPKDWYKCGGLIDDSFMMILMSAIGPSFFTYLDIAYMMKSKKRIELNQEKLDSLNEAIKNPDPASRNEVRQQVEIYKKAYSPSYMNQPRRYAHALKTFFCCVLYAPVLPLITIVGFSGLVLQYWVDKYMLLRWFKRPDMPLNAKMALNFLRLVKYLTPVCFSLAMLLFLTPSWKDRNAVWTNFGLSIFVGCVFVFLIPLSALGKCNCASSYSEVEDDSASGDYYKAQYMWSREMKYHKDHFLYKRLDEKVNPEYLKPGEQTSVNVDAVKAGYAASTEEAASSYQQVGQKMQLKGGQVVPQMSKSDSLQTSVVPSAPIPTTYGASGGGYNPAPSGYAAPDPEPQPYKPVAIPPAPVPGSSSYDGGYSGGSQGPVWEWEAGHGFKPFADDCQEYIEKCYSKYKNGAGKEQVNVRTMKMEISVNFEKMTSMNKGTHKVREIRRRT